MLLPENYPGNDVNVFLEEQLKNADLLQERAVGTTAESAVSSSKRLVFGATAFDVGITGIRGCTVAYIFSTRGMWEAHFWEYPAFLSGDGIGPDGSIIGERPSSPEVFNSAVIDYIASGDGARRSFPDTILIN